jgi:hypothetical protein
MHSKEKSPVEKILFQFELEYKCHIHAAGNDCNLQLNIYWQAMPAVRHVLCSFQDKLNQPFHVFSSQVWPEDEQGLSSSLLASLWCTMTKFKICQNVESYVWSFPACCWPTNITHSQTFRNRILLPFSTVKLKLE